MKLKHLIYILVFPMGIMAQTENYWTKKSDFGGLKRERAVAFSIDNYGYVAAGVDTSEIVHKDLWRYDPLTDTWMQKADIPGSARRDAIAFALNGKGYVGTGIDNDASLLGTKMKDLWEYNPIFNTWIQKANFPGAGGNGVYFATAFSLDGKGYVCCGKTGPNTYSNQLWEYKPSTDQWTQRANFPGGVRYQLSSFTIGYHGYVGLGANQDVFKKDFWRYNAGNNTWDQIADLPASERGGAVTFTLGNRGFVCMGNDGGILDDLWEYNPTSDQWSVRASYGGSERKNAIAFSAYGRAYVGTGKGYSGKKAGMEEYTPYANVGLDENNIITLSTFPNPTADLLTVSSDQMIAEISLYSFDGRLIFLDKSANDHFSIDMRQQVSGTYILVAKNEFGQIVSSEKVIRN
jgi:N-acetylneuraminic acid mutarotase